MPTLVELSETAICNAALIAVGAETVGAIDEASAVADVLALRYPMIRDAVLQAYKWNFAKRRASLPELSAAPAFGYAHQYLLPADCILVREVVDASQTIKWEVEDADDGPVIVTDLTAPLLILYTTRVQDVSRFRPLFVEALAARLAADLAVKLMDNSAAAERLLTVYQDKLNEARRIDAQEGSAEDQPTGDWITERNV